MQNEKNIRKILNALSEAVDKEMPKWTDAKPKTEVKAGKVSDTGSHEMENAEANYASVKDAGVKKIETKPAFSSVKDPGANGGATGVDGSGKPKVVKLKESEETEAKEEITETEEIDESTRNQRLLKTGSPALKEVDASVEKIEESLSVDDKKKAARLRETIEMLTGKKVTYKA